MKTHSATRLVHSCWLIAAALSCLAGCAQLNVKGASAIPFWPDDGNTPRVPVKVATVWVDTVRFTQGAAPARGFGGRLVFYDNKHEDPVKVDGDLVIYAFDEDNRQPGDPRPDRKYVFTAEQLPIHYSQSKLGHSYSFFLPWDEPGGPRKEISLIARFRPKGGPIVISEQTKQILPGQPEPQESAGGRQTGDRTRDDQVMPTSHQSALAGQSAPRSRMQTATIQMPSVFGRQRPVAEVRERFTRAGYSGLAEAAQAPGQPDPAGAPPTRSSLTRSRALGAPIAQLERDRAPWQQRPAAWRSPDPASLPGANASESK
ncbi:MAG: hypothetical protein PHO07_09780 [Pirellulales bacterium]|jgi:hypothetical protein|nr:hypothetical protein [Thermoguttaceae bacterium]MDD4787450.1 hypothetical protein [Pirellulales bacterium]MDI9446095.1 hypothetical protein [Planctomycetota bacterium]NLZ01856.1 hypothetical protein [Pirellulaceae bacterium]